MNTPLHPDPLAVPASYKPRDIVLIHGLWLTPRSWEGFRDLYERAGYVVHTPAWPRIKGEVEDLRHDPSALNGLGVAEIFNHYAAFIRTLEQPPILMGHSFGGLIVQLLLDRGYGAVGVSIDGVGPKGVLGLPFAALKSAFPALRNPLNARRTVMLHFKQFQYAFGNAVSEEDARAFWMRYAVPGPGRPVFEVATANLNPWSPNRVDYRNSKRAPLLLLAGEMDHQVPASVVRENYRRYGKSKALTRYHEFPKRGHLIALQAGWEEVATYALEWAEHHTGFPVF